MCSGAIAGGAVVAFGILRGGGGSEYPESGWLAEACSALRAEWIAGCPAHGTIGTAEVRLCCVFCSNSSSDRTRCTSAG